MNTESTATAVDAGASAQASPETEQPIASNEAVTGQKDAAEGQSEQSEPQQTEAASETRRRESGVSRLKRQLAEREAEIEALRSRVKDDTPIPGLGDPPKESDYADFFEFQRAASAYDAAKLTLSVQAAMRKQEAEREAVYAQRERTEAFQSSMKRAAESIPDFVPIMQEAAKRNVQGSNELLSEITSSEKGPLINYHLCKPENAALLEELNGLTGRDLAREIGRLEGRLHWPRPKTQTSAPPPVKPVGGGASLNNSQDAELSGWLRKTYGK
jgi:hypothetical protein